MSSTGKVIEKWTPERESHVNHQHSYPPIAYNTDTFAVSNHAVSKKESHHHVSHLQQLDPRPPPHTHTFQMEIANPHQMASCTRQRPTRPSTRERHFAPLRRLPSKHCSSLHRYFSKSSRRSISCPPLPSQRPGLFQHRSTPNSSGLGHFSPRSSLGHIFNGSNGRKKTARFTYIVQFATQKLGWHSV